MRQDEAVLFGLHGSRASQTDRQADRQTGIDRWKSDLVIAERLVRKFRLKTNDLLKRSFILHSATSELSFRFLCIHFLE